MNVFITAVSTYLPGNPVCNKELDKYLGCAQGLPAKTRQLILANNGIQTRYYAIDPATGQSTHTNAQMTAASVRLLRPEQPPSSWPLTCLCCGTSSPDQLMPGHGSMVHGELGGNPCEIMTTAGICLSGITAMKYAAMSVALGKPNAVATGSELASTFVHEQFFQRLAGKPNNSKRDPKKLPENPAFSFEAEFLRWMLSDGAGAVLVEKTANPDSISLRIDWIEILSHAHRLEPCMYAGAVKKKDGSLKGWREFSQTGPLEQQGIMTIKQDARLLNREIIDAMVGESLPQLITRYQLTADKVDWFLPHYSSEFFRQPLMDELKRINFSIPENRWYTNLTSKGNTGSASFFIMLEELFHSGRLQRGNCILGMIPESGRFCVGWVYLTVV